MHYTCKYLICSIIWILCCVQQYCVSQSTTVRPYKFGFTIDQQQHRSEQRDERGIVMGEFGFITADGIYHVTVYATDEQGRFRILAMKNYPYESPPKMVEVMVQPKIPVTTTTTQKPLPKHNFNTEACSGCFLKNGNNKPKGLEGIPGKTGKNDIRPLSKPLSSAANGPASPKLSNKPSPAHGNNSQNTALANSLQPGQKTQEFPLKSSTQTQNTNSANSNEQFGFTQPVTADKTPTHKVNTPSKDSNPQNSQPKPGGVATGNSPPIMDIIMKKVLPAVMGSMSSTPTTLNNKPNGSPSSKVPGSNTANDFNSKTGSSANGGGDLYRFKYILDYHGHSETGKRNGNKEGTYFAIGDDNVERTIEYVANEFGYQPRIRWRKLSDNEIKSKENTLKDYEFIWFN